jgi:hypothetical protein
MENARTPRKFSTRAFTSLLLTCAMLVVACSGVMLYLSPRGRVANWTDWTLLGLGKEEWSAVHINTCLLLLIVTVVHLALNWRPFWGYVKKKAGFGLNRKLELALAAAVAAVVVASTLYSVPPFSTLVAWQHEIKDYWERRSADAPVPHSEEFTLVEFAQHIQLSVDQMLEALGKEGYDVADPTVTVAELATGKAVPPSRVLADIRKHFPQAGSFQGRGGGGHGGRGLGRGAGLELGAGMGCGQMQGTGPEGVGPRSDREPQGGLAREGTPPNHPASGEATAPTRADEAASLPDTDHRGPADRQGLGPLGGQGLGQGRGAGRGPGYGQGYGRGYGRGGGMGLGAGRGRRAEQEAGSSNSAPE